VLPYFSENIFFNQPRHSFWLWSSRVHVDDAVREALYRHPDFIVVGDNFVEINGLSVRPGPEALGAVLESTGLYHQTQQFCGEAYVGHRYSERLCQYIFEPTKLAAQK
jgi:hypothetical protein